MAKLSNHGQVLIDYVFYVTVTNYKAKRRKTKYSILLVFWRRCESQKIFNGNLVMQTINMSKDECKV